MKKQNEFDILYEIKEEVYKTIKTLRTKKYSELEEGIIYDEKDLYSNLETYTGLKKILYKLDDLDDVLTKKGEKWIKILSKKI